MRLLQWNIQWCRGIDGRVDAARIARVAKEIADPDVACFQEVAVNFAPLGSATAAIVTGDFNVPPEDPLYARMQAPFADGVPRLLDAWQRVHPGTPNPPTFCLHDREHGAAPYCCDFVFVSADLAPRVSQVRIDLDTQASDHQPVIVELS
jgi:endonuclease/exonuclease/phosphatase family metal-dependent hydrolase